MFDFFEWLKGSEESVAMEITQSLHRNHMKVWGLNLKVTEEVIAHLTSLQTMGKWWFDRKINDPSLKVEFLQGEA